MASRPACVGDFCCQHYRTPARFDSSGLLFFLVLLPALPSPRIASSKTGFSSLGFANMHTVYLRACMLACLHMHVCVHAVAAIPPSLRAF